MCIFSFFCALYSLLSLPSHSLDVPKLFIHLSKGQQKKDYHQQRLIFDNHVFLSLLVLVCVVRLMLQVRWTEDVLQDVLGIPPTRAMPVTLPVRSRPLWTRHSPCSVSHPKSVYIYLPVCLKYRDRQIEMSGIEMVLTVAVSVFVLILGVKHLFWYILYWCIVGYDLEIAI